MIKEFAVEPTAITRSFLDFSYIVEKFGIWEGRVISEFPKTWKRQVYEAAKAQHSGTKQYLQIEDKLRRLPKGVLLSLARPGAEGEWLSVVLAEHGRNAFHAMITSNPSDNPCVVAIDDFTGDHPLLDITREKIIARTPEGITQACAFLLRTAKHVKLVDPYFDFSKKEYRGPFEAFLLQLKPNTILEIFCGNGVAKTELLRQAQLHIPRVLPPQIKIRLISWAVEPMHNRFVLTNFGGMKFGVGLNAAKEGKVQEDEASLLVPGVWQTRWAQYVGGDLIGEWG